MKRGIVVFMICLFVLCAASVAFAAEARTSGLFTYEIKGNGTAVITDYDWKNHGKEDLYIPNMLDGYTITGVGDNAFQKHAEDAYLRDGSIMVKLPESITTIGGQAFFECNFIKAINIPALVNTIGVGAFAGTGIICNVDSQNDTFAIIDNALYNKKERELLFVPRNNGGVFEHIELKIPNGIESIGEYACYDCKKFTNDERLEVVFPSTLRHIKDYAFSNCIFENSLVFPSSLETIGIGAFQGTRPKTLDKWHFPSSVNTIGEYAFSHIDLYGTEIDLQDTSITTIPACAFSGTKMGGDVVLPDTIKSIGSNAFAGADLNLNDGKFVIQEGVESIGDEAFESFKYYKFNEITLPSTLKSIGNSAFAKAKYLEQITIPDSVTSIGENIVDRKVTLVVTPGSYAETWATENGYMIKKQGGDDTSWLNYD